MKPISELVNDREACERIWKEVQYSPAKNELGEVTIRQYEDKDYCISLRSENLPAIHLWRSGRLETGIVYNPFTFVALMNELGYSPQT